MKIKNIISENFQDYKKVSMLIGTCICDWKCCRECGEDLCQNMPLANSPTITIADEDIAKLYITNPLTSAIVIGGLEPFDQADELWHLVYTLRQYTQDDIVIYTGYNEDECADIIAELKAFPRIIVKFGRFIPHQSRHYDEVLGVELASPNQYAKLVSKCEQK